MSVAGNSMEDLRTHTPPEKFLNINPPEKI